MSEPINDAMLESVVMDPEQPKTVKEWWAYREICALRAQLAATEERATEFKSIGQQFERDARDSFEQSCKNLNRALVAEATIKGLNERLAAAEERARQPISEETVQRMAEEMVTVAPNITGDRAELWIAGTFRVTASADVEDVLSAAKHMREDIAAFIAAAIRDAAKEPK